MSAALSSRDAAVVAPTPARLTGTWLTLARVAWVVLAGCAVLLFLRGIAPAFELLRTPCQPETCGRNLLSLRPEQMAALTGSGVAPELYAAAMIAVEALEAIVFVACGVLIFVRRSDERIALITSLVLILIGAFMHPNTPHSAAWTWRWLMALDFTLYMVGNWLFPALVFMMPDGRLVPRWSRWLWLAWGIYSTIAVIIAVQIAESDPSRNTASSVIGMSIMLLSLGVGVSGLVYRYRRISTPQQRQQIKWLCLGLLGMLTGMIAGNLGVTVLWAEERSLGLRVLAALLNALGLACLPICITFAILRHRLWDIDVVLNRALVYGGLTALVTLIYFLTVGGISGLLIGLQGQLAGGVIATVFALLSIRPLYRRLQSGVNRLFPVSKSIKQDAGHADSDDGAQYALVPVRWLMAARIAWVVLAGYPTLLFLMGIAPAVEFLRVPCDPATCYRNWFALLPAQMAEVTRSGISPETYAVFMTGTEVYQAIVFAGCGLLIFLRRSDAPIAIIASLGLVVLGVYLIPYTPHAFLHLHPELWALLATTYIWGQWLFPALLFLLPDGRFVPRSGRWLLLLWGIASTMGVLTLDLNKPPDQVPIWESLSLFSALACAGAGVFGQVYRYRRVATPQQRQQIKWIGLGLLGFLLGHLIFGVLRPIPASVGDMPIGLRMLLVTVQTLCITSLPLALTFAILRHRLWDIDVVLNRALVYGGVTAAIGALYVLLVAGLGAVFHTQGSAALAFVGAGIVAVLFQPLRTRVQRAVNRLMYGQRDEPYAVLARFGRQLESTPALDSLLPAITATIKDTLKLPHAKIVLSGEQSNAAAVDQPACRVTFPLTYQGATVGILIVSPREGEADLSANDRRLLEDLVRQAGVAVHAAGITTELQRARERLVTTREEERRRLRRDLHDGLGPALAAIAAQSEAARDLIPSQPGVSTSLLADIVAQSQTATADIRRLVYDLRPPALDDLGLVGAIEAQARKISQPDGLQVMVQADALPPLPAAVEVAAYRIAQEALTNVARHARAKHCLLALKVESGDLRLEIGDDGRGMPATVQAGVGMASMRERAEELGGCFTASPGKRGGTVIQAIVPITT
jgi:signal transduction histidine kinase